MCEHPFALRGEPQTGLMSSCHANVSLSNMIKTNFKFRDIPQKVVLRQSCVSQNNFSLI